VFFRKGRVLGILISTKINGLHTNPKLSAKRIIAAPVIAAKFIQQDAWATKESLIPLLGSRQTTPSVPKSHCSAQASRSLRLDRDVNIL